MLLRFIEQLRTKPKDVRNRYAFVVASGTTAIIAILWMLTLPAHFAEDEVVATSDTDGILTRFFEEARTNTANIFNAFQSDDVPAPEAVVPEATSTQEANVVIPTLTEENIRDVKKEEEVQIQAPRTVRIATTSSAVTSE